MKDLNLTISIAHLYPKLLNLYGDIGNIIALKNRCIWRGINVEFEEINIGDKIKEHDLYFVGGGQDKQQEEVAQELYSNKSELLAQRDDGAVFLGICGGYQLFGHYYKPHDKEELKGVSLMDAYTVAGDKRFIGNVTVETNFLTPKTLVGFENHSGLTFLEGETKPLAKTIIGNGNNGQDGFDGARYKNLIGLALEKRYGKYIELTKLDDSIEFDAHKSVIKKSY